MITVKNGTHEDLVVRHSETPHEGVVVKPMSEARFDSLLHGFFMVDRMKRRTRDPRFDPRGGDPYNRIGSRAFH